MATSKIFHIVIILVTFITECLCVSEMLLMCYFNSAARYRSALSKFDSPDIDFSLCTHYIYGYGFVDDYSQAVFPSDPLKELGDNGAYRDFVSRGVNSTNSSKRMLSFGGLNASADIAFNIMIKSYHYLKRFSNNAIAFLRLHHFSGLDIDWQFPVTSEMQSGLVMLLQHVYHAVYGDPVDIEVICVLQEAQTLSLRQAIDRDTTGEKLLLTVKCPALPQGHPYDVPALSQYADYVILAAYNFTPPNASLTSFGSPLYGQEITVNSTVRDWLRKGLPANKTVVGISAVGRFAVLINGSHYLPNSPIENKTVSGYFYSIPGGLAYPEACHLKDTGLNYFDDNTRMHIVTEDSHWLGFEDKKSIYEKIMWMKSLNIRGVMFAGLDEDDFSNMHCGDGNYPLLKFIKSNRTLPKQVLPKQGTTKQPPREQQTTYTIFRLLVTSSSSSTGPSATQGTLLTTDTTTAPGMRYQKGVSKKSFYNMYLILLVTFLICLALLVIACVYMLR